LNSDSVVQRATQAGKCGHAKSSTAKACSRASLVLRVMS